MNDRLKSEKHRETIGRRQEFAWNREELANTDGEYDNTVELI